MSVRRSVGPSVTHESKSGKTSVLDAFMGIGVGGEAWDVDGSWMSLPTRPQRYCDLASLAFSFLVFHNPCNFDIAACLKIERARVPGARSFAGHAASKSTCFSDFSDSNSHF